MISAFFLLLPITFILGQKSPYIKKGENKKIYYKNYNFS